MISQSVPFRETQRFNQIWLWALIIVSGLGTAGLFGYGFYQQLTLGKPWGSKPMSNEGSLWTTMGVSFSWAMIVLLFISLRLETEVRAEGLFIRFFPIQRGFKKIPLENAKEIRAIVYSPIMEYGGWGIRWGIRGKAYNVSGNKGLRIDYANGRHLLIGSQKPDDLEKAVLAVAPIIKPKDADHLSGHRHGD